MRKVMYVVVRADGTEFETSNYTEATTGGNKIKKTNLIPIDTRTEAEKKTTAAHVQKFWSHSRKEG